MEVATAGTSKYPWTDWLNGKCWYIRTQADFLCLEMSIQGQAQSWAKKLGVAVTTRLVVGGVLVQAYPLGSTWKPHLANITLNDLVKAANRHINNPR